MRASVVGALLPYSLRIGVLRIGIGVLYAGWPPPTLVVFIRLEAARSAGPRLMPCIRGLAAAISSTLETPSAVSRMA
jgi:hypothetical protein